MLNKLFAKPLSLEVAGQSVSFNTLTEVEFALAGRTDVPAKRIAEIVGLSIPELKAEAKVIKHTEQQFVDVLSQSIESPDNTNEYLRNFDVYVFSQDHQWRDIMRCLHEKDGAYDEFRRIAIVKYLQYLRSRQDVIKQTYKLKKREQELLERREETSPDTVEFDKDATPGLSDTVIFDAGVIDQQATHASEFSRLPKGEAVRIEVANGGRLDVRFSKHHFHITNESGSYILIDDKDRRHPLLNAKNVIGRDNVCDVPIDNVHRDVSRRHVIVEPLKGNALHFTDLSSHGTYVPHHHLS